MKSHYLAGDDLLVDCNLLGLRGLLSIEETQKQALVLTSSTPPNHCKPCVQHTKVTSPNSMSNPISYPTPNIDIINGLTTTKGIPLEMYRYNDAQ